MIEKKKVEIMFIGGKYLVECYGYDSNTNEWGCFHSNEFDDEQDVTTFKMHQYIEQWLKTR